MINWFDGKNVAIIGGGFTPDLDRAEEQDIVVRHHWHPFRQGGRIDVLYNPGWPLEERYLKKERTFNYMMLAVTKRYFKTNREKIYGVNFCESENIPVFLHQRTGFDPPPDTHSDFMVVTDMLNTVGIPDYVPLAGIISVWILHKSKAKEIYLTGFDFYDSAKGTRFWPVSHRLDQDRIVMQWVLNNDKRFVIDQTLADSLETG